MPVVFAVKNCEGLCDIEIEEPKGRKGPLFVVETVNKGRKRQHQASREFVSHARLTKTATYPQRQASFSKTFLSCLVAGRKVMEEMWTQICRPSQGSDRSLPCVVTRNSTKEAKHIQIRMLVGRSIQAKAASSRQRRSLFPESGFDCNARS